MKFISENKNEPFFCYLATNAPHEPYLVADKYRRLYENNPNIPEPAFYGMITNIDENFKRLEDKLDELGITDNTILIFMTDNGTSAGWVENERLGYNTGMRGIKGSYYEGGHRVPFFIRWPKGGIANGRDIGEFVNHVDLLPTFIDLCGLKPPEDFKTDGINAAPLLRGETDELPDRTIFTQYHQGTAIPDKWDCGVMTKRWRLINGQELYDIKADPGQKNDIAVQHPDFSRSCLD
jgi:arylsulfatase A-like enzyme